MAASFLHTGRRSCLQGLQVAMWSRLGPHAALSSTPADSRTRRTHIKKAKPQPAVDIAKLLQSLRSTKTNKSTDTAPSAAAAAGSHSGHPSPDPHPIPQPDLVPVPDLHPSRPDKDLRAEPVEDLSPLRAEPVEDLSALRAEHVEDLSPLRAEAVEDLSALRAEPVEDLSALRAEPVEDQIEETQVATGQELASDVAMEPELAGLTAIGQVAPVPETVDPEDSVMLGPCDGEPGDSGAQDTPEDGLDPIQKIFLDKIREYNTRSQACGGLVEAGTEFEKALLEERVKLQRLFGGGDLSQFPEFSFPDPPLDEVSPK
ncbi:uncharacterized protein LOC124474430 isoform X2 [Hypomesus transpacificus]|uniref:uncharacterized protein LOC124474430 isoform X2 n=1 Tax=Hypomesus transpacificus TaxID=137520 RepID=UPI001F079972|nr:uncharacterized protein LOC124474430 isoform X2 [Hypomesus transpacificus]